VAYKLTQKVIDAPGIPVMQKAVLVVMARHALEDGTNAKPPSVHTVAEKAGMCPRAARAALRALEAEGWIIPLSGKAGGRKQTVHYLIVAGKLEPTDTRHDVPPFDEETRHDVPPNGHDTTCETRHQMPPICETRHVDPLNPAPHAAEEVLEEKVSKGSLCVEVESTPREAHTQAAPDSSGTRSAVVVPFQQPLPAEWVLPEAWRAWAQGAGQSGIEFAAQRFFDFHFERGVRKTEAGWEHAWRRWITENIERGYGNGQQRHDHRQQRGHGDLASVVLADLPSWFGNAQGGPNPW
jgi:hypothetical protein